MKILVIGSGGREHALVWKLARSSKVRKIFCAPGNGGISQFAECVAISPEDIAGLADFASARGINLTVVGPEAPLSRGIVDEFEKRGLRIFGPRKNAAILEYSKCFTKEFCNRHNIPTAPYHAYNDVAKARESMKQREDYPVVIKADGLAAGKGVVVAKSRREALETLDAFMLDEKLGESGRKIVVEEFLEGVEATYMVATDGQNFVSLESSQDHKRIGEADTGPNTGGMGAISPSPLMTEEMEKKVIKRIIRPLIMGMREEGRPYTGILYSGLMISGGEPKLIEVNCRFGDPEAQVVLFRMKSDLVLLMEATLSNKLAKYSVKFSPQPAVCVVLSAKGYPGSYENGKKIKGLENVEEQKNVIVFHAGTRMEKNDFITSGGRVLGVTAREKDLKSALQKAYKAVAKISWDGVYYRRDIGKRP